MALANKNPLDGASAKCIPPCVQILEGPAPSLGFLFGAFSCCFAHAPSVLGLVRLHLSDDGTPGRSRLLRLKLLVFGGLC